MDFKRCSPRTTTEEEEWSELMEVTEAIQESPAIATSSLTKRKAESDPVEEESDSDSEEEKKFAAKAYMNRARIKNGEVVYNDSSSDCEIGLIKPPWWKAPEWGVDSFDELEYDSAKEENPFTEADHREKWSRFKRQFIQNKGFYVEPELDSLHGYLEFMPVHDLEGITRHGQTHGEYFAEMANLCLKKYNKKIHRKTNGFDVEFVEIVRGMYTVGPKSKAYITFMAKEKPDGSPVEYQCKVWRTFQKGQNYPILCRPAPLVKKL